MAASPTVSVRISHDHAALIDLAAEVAGVSKADFLRAAITAALREQLAPTSESRPGAAA